MSVLPFVAGHKQLMGAKVALSICVGICALSSDVNVAFQQSAHKVLLDDDNLLPLLHLTIEYHGKEHKGIYLHFWY